MQSRKPAVIPGALLLAAISVIPALAFTRWIPGSFSVRSAPVGAGDLFVSSQERTPAGSSKFDRQQVLAAWSRDIAGSENKPSGEVYKNVIVFRQMPAGQLLIVMNAFSRALGTDCVHCHDAGAWESEVKPEKQVAREMFKMVIAINRTYLKNIKGLKS